MIKTKPSVQNLAPYQGPPADRIEKIRLDFNEVNLPPSPRLSALKFDPSLSGVYPQEDALIAKLAEHFQIDPKSFLVSNGSNEAITLILEAFIQEGDEVVIPFPTFSVYYLLLQSKNAKIKKISYDAELNFPRQQLLQAAKNNPKLIILVNPNNPTGDMLKKAEIEEILQAAPDTLLVLDEAYVHFADEELWDLILRYENLIVLRTFSKAYALAGHRIGFALADPKTMALLYKVSLPFRVNHFSLKAAEIALDDEEHFRYILTTIKTEKAKMEKFLQSLKIDYLPSQTNFLLVKTGVWSKAIYLALAKQGIMVRHQGSNPLLKSYLRISMGTPAQNEKFFAAFQDLWENRLLAFDMDGTLIDVQQSYIQSIKDTVAHFSGKSVGSHEIDSVRKKGGYNNDWDLTEYLLLQEKVTIDKDEIIAKFEDFYLKNKQTEKWLLPREDLATLSENIPLAIFSGRPKRDIAYALDFFKMEKFFSHIVAMEDTQDKPKPDGYGLEILQKISKAKLIAYVGDTVDDISAGLSTDCVVINLLKDERADYCLNDIKEIKDLVLK